MPTDFEIAAASKPMGVNLAALTLGNDSRPDPGEIEGGNCQHKAQTREHSSRADTRGFKLKAIGFIIQKALLNIKPQAVFDKRLGRGGLLTITPYQRSWLG